MRPAKQGDLFESQVMTQAVCRGLRCDIAHRGLSHDLLISGKRVQCKSKTLKRGGVPLHNHRKVEKDEFDVLALTYRVDADDDFRLLYLIPMAELPSKDGRVVWELRQRWLAQHPEYIDNWAVFD